MKIKKFNEDKFNSSSYMTKIKPNYEIGDEVICVCKTSELLQYKKKYIVEDISMKGQGGLYFTKVEDQVGEYHSDKFKSELEMIAKKYNL